MLIYVIVAVVSYLLGSIPFGYILVRLFRGEDVRATGSGNIGATNVMRSGSKGLGIATLVLDALKGFAAVNVAYWIGNHSSRFSPIVLTEHNAEYVYHYLRAGLDFTYMLAAIAALFAIIGHMYPIWLKFKGGKGVATGVGTFLAIAPKAVGLVILIFLGIVALSRYVSLGSIVATAMFPLLAWLLYRNSISPIVFPVMLLGSALIIAKHHQNIRRLLAGTENRFGSKKGASA